MKIACLAILALAAGPAAAQDRMADRLRKAVVEEESQHNLAAAAADYAAVVTEFDQNRKTAATALFHLAECQRQLHHDEQARADYERVVREFSDQADLAARSAAVLERSYNVAASKPAAAPDRGGEAARQRYRALLLQQIEVANQNIHYVEKQLELGAISPLDLEGPRQEKIRLERELAAFDMGILPQASRGNR